MNCIVIQIDNTFTNLNYVVICLIMILARLIMILTRLIMILTHQKTVLLRLSVRVIHPNRCYFQRKYRIVHLYAPTLSHDVWLKNNKKVLDCTVKLLCLEQNHLFLCN